jgi:hypothetical protein
MVPHQRMRFFGEQKELEIKIPFNAPNDRSCEIRLYSGNVHLEDVETINVDVCDQYRIMTEAFSKAVTEDTEVPVPLEYSLANTCVLEAIFHRQGRTDGWI